MHAVRVTGMRKLAALWAAVLAAALVCAPAPGRCDSTVSGLFRNIEVSGYVKSLNVDVEPSRYHRSAGFFSLDQQRIAVSGETKGEVFFDVAVENSFYYAASTLEEVRPYLRDRVNRRLDLAATPLKERHGQDTVDVDRLLVGRSTDTLEWTLGRQAVGFGRMAMVSPLDVVAPFSPDALETDVRPGVDALRATRYFGLAGQLGGAMVLGDGPGNNSYLATFTQNVHEIDILGIAGSLRDRALVGGGLAGEVQGLGLKAEVAAYKGKDAPDGPDDLHAGFAIGAVEAWYRFEDGLELLAEYLYNGAGESSPERYPAVVSSAATQEGLNSLMGRHYLLLNPSYEVHPLVEVQGLVLWNLHDGSTLVRPSLDISLTDDMDLQLFWTLALGRGPRDADSAAPVPRSEFGSIGDYGGVWLKYYF